ncbi:mitochondrial folate transporter/carrier-like [Anneissia japonica]|uniref:mitochondrial folate transporter/carrier-like n=1 Tax=Anneissia japonica TaxID=1529436 RepID=UPI0014259657|nr:mitochondrial folate transporter/carrier-like [Anneissia japonica]
MSLFKGLNYEHFVAGISGGVLSTLVLHPFDLLKIRLQVNDGMHVRPTYTGFVQAFQSVVKTQGFFGLYQGVTPNIWGAGASWGFYFFFYNAIKNYMQGDEGKSLGPGHHMLAAAQSGVVTLFITNPIWVVKTRLCLQYDGVRKTGVLDAGAYRGMLDGLLKIYRFEGLGGLYKGLLPGLFGVSHGALQFMAYEELKKSYALYKGHDVNTLQNPLEYIAFAALSKMFAVVTTYPYQVVRSRLQDRHTTYSGTLDAIRTTYRNESWRGFYKGMLPNILRVTPACCITFVVYENMTYYLKNR